MSKNPDEIGMNRENRLSNGCDVRSLGDSVKNLSIADDLALKSAADAPNQQSFPERLKSEKNFWHYSIMLNDFKKFPDKFLSQKSIDLCNSSSLLPLTNAKLRGAQSSRSFRACFGTMQSSNVVPVNQTGDDVINAHNRSIIDANHSKLYVSFG